MEDDSEDDIDSQNEEDTPEGERAIAPGGTHLISHKNHVG